MTLHETITEPGALADHIALWAPLARRAGDDPGRPVTFAGSSNCLACLEGLEASVRHAIDCPSRVEPACVVCDGLGCEHCPKVAA